MEVILLFGLIIGLLLLGVPIAVSLGFSSIVFLLVFSDTSLGSIAQSFYQAMAGHYTLLAIPFFILASSFMSTGGVARRIIRFSIACVGHLRGGLAIAGVFACMLFAALSGSSPATVVAIGSIVIVGMREVGYTKDFAAGVIALGMVFGAFSAEVLRGAFNSLDPGQSEAGLAVGMTTRQVFLRIKLPQVWRFALPGLGNLWMVLIKATPLLFLLGVEDVVYWARELGGSKTPRFTDYPHGDWRMWYFLALLVFYLVFTRVSEIAIARMMTRLTRGQATTGGEAQRKAA